MLCAAPYRQGIAEFGCGKCMPCQFNRRRLWASRLMLEAQLHESSFFVTLTYDKEHLPCDMSVSIRDAQLFLKKLREKISPARVRYYIVGEYGDVSQRPHYHAALFGLTRPDLVESCWPMGFVHVGLLTGASASYVVSYIIKGLTSVADVRLKGRHPEFARMSLKPGIGAGAMKEVARGLFTKAGSKFVAETGDVVSSLRADGSIRPLGRYLRRKLREECGMEPGQPAHVGHALAVEKLQELSLVGGRASRESSRVQTNHRAKVLHAISLSKRGIGL